MKAVNILLLRKTGKGGKFSFARLILIPALISLFILSITTCRKDDDDKETAIRESAVRIQLDEISADSIESFVNWLVGMGTRFALAANHRSVALDIKNKFTSFGYADAALDSFLITKTYRNVTYNQWQYNVTASIEGTDYPDSVCILGSHYDSITGSGDPFAIAPGAHDNASGTAATLEIARVLKKTGFSPKRTIRFVAFGAEELGLFGSYSFVSKYESTRSISFMLNNDMIGYENDSNPGSWIVNILDYPNSTGLRKEAQDIAKRYTSLSYINNNRYNKQSDSYPFAMKGFKSLFFSSVDEDPYYHTVNDLPGNVNYEYCSEITKLSCAILAERNL